MHDFWPQSQVLCHSGETTSSSPRGRSAQQTLELLPFFQLSEQGKEPIQCPYRTLFRPLGGFRLAHLLVQIKVRALHWGWNVPWHMFERQVHQLCQRLEHCVCREAEPCDSCKSNAKYINHYDIYIYVLYMIFSHALQK